VSQPAEVEPVVPAAHFVEEIEIPPVEEDTGGTLIIPTGVISSPLSVEQTEIHTPVEEISDVGTTLILGPETESPPVSEEAPFLVTRKSLRPTWRKLSCFLLWKTTRMLLCLKQKSAMKFLLT